MMKEKNIERQISQAEIINILKELLEKGEIPFLGKNTK